MRRLSSLVAAGLFLAATPGFAQATDATPGSPTLPATLQPQNDDYHQYTASVIERTPLMHQGDGQYDLAVHLYGTAGGDPAMNGLHTYLAFYQSPGDGYRVFEIGDFNAYRVVSETKGRLLLEVDENIINEGSGEIGSRTRRMVVTWTPPGDGMAPATVSVGAIP